MFLRGRVKIPTGGDTSRRLVKSVTRIHVLAARRVKADSVRIRDRQYSLDGRRKRKTQNRICESTRAFLTKGYRVDSIW